MKKSLIFIACLLVTGCGEYESIRTVKRLDFICGDSTIEKRAEFTLSCIANANPNSDEEPEDWIMLCQKMAIKNYCHEKTVNVSQQRECSNCSWTDSGITLAQDSNND